MTNEKARLITLQVTIEPRQGIFDLEVLNLEQAIKKLPKVLAVRNVATVEVPDPRSLDRAPKPGPDFYG